MSRSFACPSCGEDEDVRGAPSEQGIVLTCQACGHQWPREELARCATCGSPDVRQTYRGVLSLGRAAVTSMTGRQEVRLCTTCDADAIARYTDRSHTLPPDYVSAAMVRRDVDKP